MNWGEMYDIIEKAYLRIGLPTIILTVMFAAYFGFLQSPANAIEAKLGQHIVDTTTQAFEAKRQTRLLAAICRKLTGDPKDCDLIDLILEESAAKAHQNTP